MGPGNFFGMLPESMKESKLYGVEIDSIITSKGTMDKANGNIRKYIAQRVELLGAVRLPNNAFSSNAGAVVTSDIIFLKKRERMIDLEQDWQHIEKTPEEFILNSYFVEHPEMILGELELMKNRK